MYFHNRCCMCSLGACSRPPTLDSPILYRLKSYFMGSCKTALQIRARADDNGRLQCVQTATSRVRHEYEVGSRNPNPEDANLKSVERLSN